MARGPQDIQGLGARRAALRLLDAVLRRSCAVRHMIWLAGGAFLLLRAERFASEFALLALPAVALCCSLLR